MFKAQIQKMQLCFSDGTTPEGLLLCEHRTRAFCKSEVSLRESAVALIGSFPQLLPQFEDANELILGKAGRAGPVLPALRKQTRATCNAPSL